MLYICGWITRKAYEMAKSSKGDDAKLEGLKHDCQASQFPNTISCDLCE